jgi:hypothetical protein
MNATVSKYFLYVAGGVSSNDVALNSIEYASIDISEPTTSTDSANQVVSGFTTAGQTLATARFNLNGVFGTNAEFNTVAAGTTRIWFGGGSTNVGTKDVQGANAGKDSDTFLIDANGEPQTAIVAGAGFPWGYCIAKGGDRFRIAGGGTTSGNACSKMFGAPFASDGTYQNPNSDGDLIRCRRYSSCQRVGAFVFNCAGHNGDNSQIWNSCELNFF